VERIFFDVWWHDVIVIAIVIVVVDGSTTCRDKIKIIR
jgi:hypothetical protein